MSVDIKSSRIKKLLQKFTPGVNFWFENFERIKTKERIRFIVFNIRWLPLLGLGMIS